MVSVNKNCESQSGTHGKAQVDSNHEMKAMLEREQGEIAVHAGTRS
jgi:hypothetical protein